MDLDFKRDTSYIVPYRTFTDISPEMKEAALRALEVKNFGVLGWEGINFEREFAEMCGVKHAIALNAGTSALFSGMLACGIGSGDEVILSAFTFWGASHVIVNTGATPVFVEPDPITFNIDPAKIETAITPKTKAIEVVHMYGQPFHILWTNRTLSARFPRDEGFGHLLPSILARENLGAATNFIYRAGPEGFPSLRGAAPCRGNRSLSVGLGFG